MEIKKKVSINPSANISADRYVQKDNNESYLMKTSKEPFRATYKTEEKANIEPDKTSNFIPEVEDDGPEQKKNCFKGRKTITFDRNIKEQNTAYIFLEKIRYKQTKFLTKLIMDFMNTNNISLTDDYDKITDICNRYTGNGKYKVVFTEKNIDDIMSSFEAINEKLNTLCSTAQIGLPITESEKSDNEIKEKSESTQIKEAPAKSENMNLQDEENDTEGLDDMLSSFKLYAADE